MVWIAGFVEQFKVLIQVWAGILQWCQNQDLFFVSLCVPGRRSKAIKVGKQVLVFVAKIQ